VPRRGPRLADRLSYANVIATVALFIGLGGTSYAIVTLPEHSVGQRQLKAGAVTPGALAFPLGVHGFVGKRVPYEPSEARCPLGSCQVRLAEEPFGQLHLRGAGQLFVFADVEIEGSSRESAIVRVALFENQHAVAEDARQVGAGETISLPLAGVGAARAGNNSVGFAASALYGPSRRGILIQRVSIIAVALPSQ
jgi:hypothetical protein